jgi:hypothetical protein
MSDLTNESIETGMNTVRIGSRFAIESCRGPSLGHFKESAQP